MFVFLVCILIDDFVASFHCEKIGNLFLLNDAYLYWGCTWDFHPCHFNFMDFIFDSCVHWAHKNLPRRLEGLVWIHPHFGDIYFMMDKLYMFCPSSESGILLCNLHDSVIHYGVIAILHSTFHDGDLCMMLMMLRRMHMG